jgi:hypothetical protein
VKMLSSILGFLLTRRLKIIAAVTLLLVYHGQTLGAGKTSGSSVPFALADIHFEQNVTDGDVEVVFEVKAGDEGLARLAVISPDGQTVIDFTAPKAPTLGIRQFRFESPEPKDIESLKAAYPEGTYTFDGVTATGDRLHGTASLNHTLPAAVSILQPSADARGVAVKDMEIAWTSAKNPAACIVEIEQDELEVSIKVKLPGSASRFVVPNGFLFPAKKYELGIGAVSDKGNISFVETTFTTSEKK